MGINKVILFNKKNLFNLFFVIVPLLILLYCFFKDVYYIRIFTVLMLFPLINTLKILYKNKNGLIFVYLIYLSLSCLGIPLVNLFVDDPFKNMEEANVSWYYFSSAQKSILISMIFVLVFCFFASVFTVKKTEKKFPIESYHNKKYFIMGSCLILIFSIFLSYQFLTGKLSLFTSYYDYYSKLNSIPYYFSFLFIFAIGVVFVLASTNKKNLKWAIFMIIVPGLILLITGNRGELLYPLLAGIGVLIVRGIKINRKMLLILGFVFFIIIPFIGEIRNQDKITNIAISPLDPFVTIGYTLRPIVYTVSWIENGEVFLGGDSFFVPLQRGIANNLPGIEPLSYEGKKYNYRERLPTMGYSIIAEIYHNFGIIGSVLSFPIIILFLLIGESANRFSLLIFSSGIAAILINNVRNAFSFVPGQVVTLIFIILGFNMIWILLSKRYKQKEIAVKCNSQFI